MRVFLRRSGVNVPCETTSPAASGELRSLTLGEDPSRRHRPTMVEIAHHLGLRVERQDIINISRTGRPRATTRIGRDINRRGSRPAARSAGAIPPNQRSGKATAQRVFFDRLYLDTDDVVDDRLAEPFDDFLYQPEPAESGAYARTSRRTQNGVTWDAGEGISAGAALLQRIAHGEGLSKAAMVELRGLEPLTFSLRRHRVHLVRRKHRVIDVHVAAAEAP
jgi:hypothetical protein